MFFKRFFETRLAKKQMKQMLPNEINIDKRTEFIPHPSIENELLRITAYPSFSDPEEIIFSHNLTIYQKNGQTKKIQSYDRINDLVNYFNQIEFKKIHNIAQLDGNTYNIKSEQRDIAGLKSPDLYTSKMYKYFLLTVYHFVRKYVSDLKIPFNDYEFDDWIINTKVVFKNESRFNLIAPESEDYATFLSDRNGLEYRFTKHIASIESYGNKKLYELIMQDLSEIEREMIEDMLRFEYHVVKNTGYWIGNESEA